MRAENGSMSSTVSGGGRGSHIAVRSWAGLSMAARSASTVSRRSAISRKRSNGEQLAAGGLKSLAGLMTVLLGSLLGCGVCRSEFGLGLVFVCDRVNLAWGG